MLPVKVSTEGYDLSLSTRGKDVRLFSRGWTDSGLKETGIESYNEVETKPGSEVIMKFNEWPLLVEGQYGKGRTLVFMGFTPKDKSAEATWRALYSQMLLAATGENPEYRYATVTGRQKPLFQLLKEQPEGAVKASPGAIESAAKDGMASFKVEITNGDRFARLLRLRMEWSGATAEVPLPLYGENFFDLFPGEKKEVGVDVAMPEGFKGTAKGTLILEGTNVPESRIPVSLTQ